MIEQAIAKVGANEIMQYQKMRVLVRLGDSAAALKEAESLLKSGSRLAPVALFVAQTRDQMGQGTIALAAYESVLEVEPSNRSALLRAGDLSWAAGAKAAAVVHYEQLISLPSEKASPRESRADLRVAEHFEGQGTDGLLRAIRTLQKLSSDAQRGLVREIAISELQQRIKALEDRVQSQAIPKQASGLRQDAGVRQ
jgi:tetratricopeptide (TPR) repeat protein